MSKKEVTPQPDFVYDPLKHKPQSDSKKLKKSDFVFDPKNPDSSSHLSNDFSDLQPPTKPRWRKVMKVILIVLGVLGIIAAAIALYLYLTAGKISSNPFGFGKLKGEADGRVNILLLGIGDPGHAGETLADTNMVVSINTKTNPAQVSMISLPRDLQVKIAGDGEGKLNEAHAYGEQQDPPDGIATSQKTIEDTLGIPIHYFVRANFTGLRDAVNAVGGVDINVQDALIDPEYPCEKNEGRSCGLNIQPGMQHMDGSKALQYARCRKGTCGDDFGRAERQQEVLTAVRDKVLNLQTLANPSKVTQLIGAASNNVKTDLSINNIQRLQELTKDTNKNDFVNVVFSIKPNGFLVSSKTSSNLLPVGGSFDDIKKFVANIFTLGPIWKEDSNITVLNGTTTVGLSGKFEKYLSTNGIPIVVESIGNASTKDYTTSQIIDYTGGAKPNTAKYLADLLGVQVTQPETPVKNPVVDFEVILGSDYVAKTTSTAQESTN